MNIVVISNSAAPSKNASSLQVSKLCEAFSYLNHKVTLILPNTGNGEDYFSFYNGAIQGTDKAIKQFTEQINIRENILNKLDPKSREITENKLNND